MPQTVWLINSRNVFPIVPASSHGGRRRDLCEVFSIRAQVPFMRASFSRPEYLAQPPPPNATILDGKIPACEFWDGHKHSDESTRLGSERIVLINVNIYIYIIHM